MTSPGGSMDAEFLDPAFATTPCPECAVEVRHPDLPAHLVKHHGVDPDST